MDVKEQRQRDAWAALANAVGAVVPEAVRMYPAAVELAAIERLAALLSSPTGRDLVKALAEGATAAVPTAPPAEPHRVGKFIAPAEPAPAPTVGYDYDADHRQREAQEEPCQSA